MVEFLKLEYIDMVLRGDHAWINYAFQFDTTEEGDDFWIRVYHNGLTPTSFHHLLQIRKKYFPNTPLPTPVKRVSL